MRFPLLALAALVLAGCSTPANEPAPPATDDGQPIDLSGRLGLMLVDLEARTVQPYTEQESVAWMSPSGVIVTWTDLNFATVLNRSTGAREVAPLAAWARVYDNATGLQIEPGVAHVRDLLTQRILSTTPLPPAPREGGRWTAASEGFDVLGAEYPPVGRAPPCANEIFLRAVTAQRTIGCHLRIAADGRAAWTEAAGVRVRATNGTIDSITGPGRGDAANDSFVAHENPVFTADGVLYLRITGGDEVARTEVIGEEGEAVVALDGPRRMALHDASLDGRYLLLRTFDR